MSHEIEKIVVPDVCHLSVCLVHFGINSQSHDPICSATYCVLPLKRTYYRSNLWDFTSVQSRTVKTLYKQKNILKIYFLLICKQQLFSLVQSRNQI